MADETVTEPVAAITETVKALPTVAEQSAVFIDMFTRFSNRVTQPWSAYQVGIILVLIAVSYGLYRFYRPRVREFLGGSHGLPKWFLRICAVLNQRLWLLLFVVLSWATVFVMREATWPSRSYFVALAATLALWWLIVVVTTRLIRSRPVRQLVRWAAGIFVVLTLFGLRETAANALDTVALDMGGTRVSLLTVLIAVVSLATLFVVASFLSKAGSKRINTVEDMSPSIRVLLNKALQLTLYTIAFMIGLRVIGFDIGNLALLSGAIGLGIGFGLQKIVSNLVSGVIILLDKSIKPGDVISLDGTFGWITQLGARYASVLTRDGREYLIPNEDFITSQVINWSHSSDLVRLEINFGVSYDSNPHEVKRLASDAPLSVSRVVGIPKPVCHIVNFGDSSIDFTLRFWIRDSTAGLTNVRGDVFLALWDVLAENNIEIPFPRRDVTILSGAAPTSPLPSNPLPED
ncbi:mechanosensitive ion channel domain-containing protein [Roseobacter sp. N2S]|uniref:mechanosensitive ion channel family protein n=1 Tax=Roseobacter sp. N2S TaxID=2663844 RepID=UPI00285F492E|nr:mechanosensitive ion channel domain-containing protein [Roseobacter sp. N2S]MDR6263187.1 small-conductance mechanosensitive channel [Roseobacter sp. N2S]